MSDIEWKEGAVCFADGEQLFANHAEGLTSDTGDGMEIDSALEFKDFQLNTINQGDYVEASELDIEQKYNNAVEVFGLFEFVFQDGAISEYSNLDGADSLVCCDDGLWHTNSDRWSKRKLTYPQIMAIGELKRLELEKSAPKIAPDLTPDLGIVSSNKYERDITDRQGNSAVVDVYDVLKAFEVTCPATQHALKKLLCSGLRGHKDLQTDLLEAKESITRAIELNG